MKKRKLFRIGPRIAKFVVGTDPMSIMLNWWWRGKKYGVFIWP